MNDDRVITIIWIVGALALTGSALAHRRIGANGKLKLALLWLGIILAAWGLVVVIQRVTN